MKRFYGTFMQSQAFKDLYITIEAFDLSAARVAMFKHFGSEFMTVYSEERFAGQPEQFNLRELCRIKAIDHGSSIEYRLLSSHYKGEGNDLLDKKEVV